MILKSLLHVTRVADRGRADFDMAWVRTQAISKSNSRESGGQATS